MGSPSSGQKLSPPLTREPKVGELRDLPLTENLARRDPSLGPRVGGRGIRRVYQGGGELGDARQLSPKLTRRAQRLVFTHLCEVILACGPLGQHVRRSEGVEPQIFSSWL